MKKYYPVVIFGILIIAVMLCSMTGIIDDKIGMCVALGLIVILNIVVSIIAFKHEVKLVGFIMICCTLVGIGLLGINIYSSVRKEKDENDFYLTVKDDISPKKLLFVLDGVNYYTYNLNSVVVNGGKEKSIYSLEDALKKGYVTFDKILENTISNEGTNGYKIYYDGGSDGISDDEYSVTVCENSDVIFSTFNYVYDEEICKN